MPFAGWRPLRAGAGSEAVLGVDFTQARVRAQAGFAQLVPMLPEPYPVWGTVEEGWQLPGDPAARLSGWLAASEDLRARAVLGYCAGAPLACALARHLADRTGAPVDVVLFDPSVAGPLTLYYQFDAALGSLAAVLAEAEVAAAREAALRDAEAAGDLDALAATLAGRYTALAGPACASQGVPASIADQMCTRLATHLGYFALSAAAELAYPPETLIVLSAEHDPPPLGGRVLRLPVGQNALLGDPAAAAAVGGLLAGVRS
ncbi:hypothetical protein GCM10023170_020760 [Phytohabitans houttuyneae]|uniref:hypothetical protein n=1 Tax=Phytohabitans houttuyneae TaxID=1076126 RepID=UPI0031F13BC1